MSDTTLDLISFLRGQDRAPVITPEEMDKEAADATTTVPAPPSSVTLANIWRHPDAHPLVLDILLLRQYGPEWFEWEHETLAHFIPDDFKTPSVSAINLEKVQAMKTLHFVDSFWQKWEVFVPCTMALNGVFPDFQNLQVPTAAQCLVSVDIANRVRSDVMWTDEVKKFVETVFRHDGIFVPIQPVDFITIENPPVDAKLVLEKWQTARSTNKLPTGPEPVDSQVRRLATITGYLEESRVRLYQQLRLIA